MPKFNVSVPHQAERTEIVEKLRGFSEKVRDSAPVELKDVVETWDDSGNLSFSFTAMGLKISGAATVSDQNVTVAGEMPFAAAMFRGAIELQIKDKLLEAIAP